MNIDKQNVRQDLVGEGIWTIKLSEESKRDLCRVVFLCIPILLKEKKQNMKFTSSVGIKAQIGA